MDRAIFLTGATGFIGGRLCLALLRGSPATLYCLVRGRTARGARERLHAYLSGLDGLPFDADRLRVVPGNLVRPRLGLPAAIYRPGLVLGDSRTGAYADTELSVRLIRAAVAAGCAPVTAAEVPAAPVDYVAEAIAALSLSDTAAGGVPRESVEVFHPNLPEPIPVATLFDHVRACGYDLPECDPAGWRAALFRRVERPAATMALACWEAMSYLVVPELRYLPPLERATATHDALRGLGVRPPDVDVPMMARILARLAADGLLPSPEAQGRAQFPSQRV